MRWMPSVNLVLVDELPRSVNVTAERNVCKLSITTVPVVHLAHHKLPRTSHAIRDPTPFPTDGRRRKEEEIEENVNAMPVCVD